MKKGSDVIFADPEDDDNRKKLPAVSDDFRKVVPLNDRGQPIIGNDPLLPIINSEAGVELLGLEDGWVVGMRGNRLMRFPTEKHMITMGTTGSGKGTSVAIPNLLVHEGSAFSLEMAGTTYRNTVNFRKHVLRQKVYVIDPWGATGVESDSINLLDTLDPSSPRFFNEAKAFANTLLKDVEVSGKDGSSSYFENNAHGLLTALIIYVKTSGNIQDEDRNIPKILELASTFGNEEWNELMAQFKLDNSLYSALLKSVGNYFYKKDNENVQSIFSTMTKKFMDIMDPSVAKLFKKSTFSPSELRDGNTTLYVVFKEAGDMSGSPAFLRLLVERTIAAYPNMGDGGLGFQTTGGRLLMLLDEFTNLGKIDGIDKDMATVRQKGITIWAMFQNMAQLEEVYGKNVAQSILANAGALQFLDARDDTTLDFISRRMGKRITFIPTVQHGVNWGVNSQNNWNQTRTLGISDTITEGSSISNTESWNDTESTGLSVSDSNTRTTGTSDSISHGNTHSTSMNSNIAYSTSVYTSFILNSGARVRDVNLSGAYNRDATGGGITNSVTTSNGTQTSDAHSTQKTHSVSESTAATSGKTSSVGSSRSVGGSVQTGKNSSVGTTNSRSDANTKGGSEGTSQGGNYSVTYTPHIIPSLEPWQIDDVLTDNRQLLIIRAKNKNMRIIDQKPNFYEIPALMLRVNGPRIMDAPILIGNLIPPMALTYLPTPLITYNIPSFTKATVEYSKLNEVDPFNVPERRFLMGKSGMEKLLTARAQVDISDEDDRKKNLVEKNRIFLSIASDIQASSVALSLERDQLEVRVKKQWEDLDGQVRSMETSHGQLAEIVRHLKEKRMRVAEFEDVLRDYQVQLLEDFEYEGKYHESVCRYKGYIDFVHDLRKRWGDFDVAERPLGISTLEAEVWTREDLKTFISKNVAKFSKEVGDAPDIPTRPAREWSPDYPLPMPANDLKNMKTRMHEGFEVSLVELDALLKDKMEVVRRLQKGGDPRRADFFASLTLRQCQATREHFVDFIENKTNADLHGMRDGQRRFVQWQEKDAEKLSMYSCGIGYFRDALVRRFEEMRQIKSALDGHWKYLEERYDQLNHANQILEARRLNALNNMGKWEVWDGLEEQTRLLEDKRAGKTSGIEGIEGIEPQQLGYVQQFDSLDVDTNDTRINFQGNQPN